MNRKLSCSSCLPPRTGPQRTQGALPAHTECSPLLCRPLLTFLMCCTARQVHLLSPLTLLLRAPSFLLTFPWLVLSSRPSLSSKAAVPNLFGTSFMEDSVSTDRVGGWGMVLLSRKAIVPTEIYTFTTK